jgi:ABC-2 type transport system permease protein
MIFIWNDVDFPGQTDRAFMQQLTCYFLAIFVIRQLTTSVIIPEFDSMVTSGEFSYRLVRPLHPYWQFLFDQYMDPIFRLPAIAIFLCLTIALIGLDGISVGGNPLLAAVSLCLSLVIHYNLQFAVACLAFWIERIGRMDHIQGILYFFLGGGFAPIALMPGEVQTVALFTPFPYALGLPAELLAGTTADSVLVWRLAVQVLWAVGLVLIARGVYRLSIRHFAAVGG